MAIELEGDLGERINQGMNMGGGIELPFLAPVLWAINGDAKLKQLGGAQYYGGWATKDGDFDDAMNQNGVGVPAGFSLSEITASDGTAFAAYTTRSVLVAPIAVRRSWLIGDGQRAQEYQPGARQHVQALCFMGSKDDKKYAPWGPVVLSAKGFQAKNLANAFGAWTKHTAGLRRKIAPNVPAWFFYLAIGTFGQDREAKMVGKAAQSPITPISAYLPASLTEAVLENVFVGKDVARRMADYLDQAGEWINAFHAENDKTGGPGNGSYEDEYVPPNYEDEVPF